MRTGQFEDESLLRLAAIEIYEDAVREYQSLGEDDAPMLSQQQVDEQFKQLMARYRQEQRAHHFRSLSKKGLRRAVTVAAAVAVLCSSAFTVAMASSPTIRGIILEDFGKYSDLVMLFSGDQKVKCPAEWTSSFYPSYIPNGFEYIKIFNNAIRETAFYQNSDGKILEFTVFPPDTQMSINTENMKQYSVDINNYNATLLVDEESCKASILINQEDCIVYISGSVSSEEILKIAKSINQVS